MRWSGLLSITMYFYSRPCGRGDYLALEAEATQIIISTHAPAGGATLQKRQCDAAVFISTHAPAGGATLTSFLPRCLIHLFLLTPLREGRHCRQALAEHNHEFLLTPLREGRRARRGRCCRKGKISTHAPAGGATRPSCLLVKRSGNFYSRPCGRGDRRHSFGVSAPRSFLLTPLREGRRFQRDGGAGVYVISTHAPAGGATFAWSRLVATA